MEKTKKTLRVVVNVLLWLFLAFSVFITILAFAAQSNSSRVPSLGGKYVLTVSSNSMQGTFNKGDIIIGNKISDADKSKLDVGDVITFETTEILKNGAKALNTHRIIEVHFKSDGSLDYCMTHGDNNPANMKEKVNAQDIVCRWDGARIAKLGTVLGFLQSSLGFFLFIIVPLIAFFLYEVFVFIKKYMEIRGTSGSKKKLSAEEEEEIKRKAIEEYLRMQKEAENNAGEEKKDGE